MEYLLSPVVLVCFAHTKPNFRLCVASKNLKLLIASPLVVAKTFERCKPSIKCQNIGFNVKYNSASPVALVSGVQKLCGFVSSSIFLKTHRTVGSSSPFIKSEGKRRVNVGAGVSWAISQASVNRMSQTHWEPRQEVKEGENCFVSEQNCQLRLQTMPNKYSITSK